MGSMDGAKGPPSSLGPDGSNHLLLQPLTTLSCVAVSRITSTIAPLPGRKKPTGTPAEAGSGGLVGVGGRCPPLQRRRRSRPPGMPDVVHPAAGAAGGASTSWAPRGRASQPGPRPAGETHATPRGHGARLPGQGPLLEAPRDEQGKRPRPSSPSTRAYVGRIGLRRRGVEVWDPAGIGLE
jgi:hypothetical protein